MADDKSNECIVDGSVWQVVSILGLRAPTIGRERGLWFRACRRRPIGSGRPPQKVTKSIGWVMKLWGFQFARHNAQFLPLETTKIVFRRGSRLNQSLVEATISVTRLEVWPLPSLPSRSSGGRTILRSPRSLPLSIDASLESLESNYIEVLQAYWTVADVLQHCDQKLTKKPLSARTDERKRTSQTFASSRRPDCRRGFASQPDDLIQRSLVLACHIRNCGYHVYSLERSQIGQIEFHEVLSPHTDSVQILRGWADSIHRGRNAHPFCKITPLGDILADTTFQTK